MSARLPCWRTCCSFFAGLLPASHLLDAARLAFCGLSCPSSPDLARVIERGCNNTSPRVASIDVRDHRYKPANTRTDRASYMVYCCVTDDVVVLGSLTGDHAHPRNPVRNQSLPWRVGVLLQMERKLSCN